MTNPDPGQEPADYPPQWQAGRPEEPSELSVGPEPDTYPPSWLAGL